jgi:hypothetical protein
MEAHMATETKRQNLVTFTVSKDTFDVTITLPKTVTYAISGAGEVVGHLDKCHAAVIAQQTIRGGYERVKDKMAVSRSVEGVLRTEGEMAQAKLDAGQSLWDHWETGTSEYEMPGGGQGGGGRSIAVEAFAQDLSIPYGEAKERAERVASAKGRNWKQQLAALEKVYAREIAELRRARVQAIEIDEEEERELLKGAAS